MRIRRFWTNRTACDVLAELREVVKLSSASNVSKDLQAELIQELQVMYNRMEAGLSDARDLKEINELRHKAKEKLKELENKLDFHGVKLEDDDE